MRLEVGNHGKSRNDEPALVPNTKCDQCQEHVSAHCPNVRRRISDCTNGRHDEGVPAERPVRPMHLEKRPALDLSHTDANRKASRR